MTGYVLDPTVKATLTFTVDLRNNCENVVITKASNQILTYTIRDSALVFNTFNFNQNLGVCGSFIYTCLYSNGNPVDARIFTFDSSVPSISI